MRQFTASYLEDTRQGMWADDRSALEGLGLADCDRILDVGCGTGALTTVLREESDAIVVGVDADGDLLEHVEADGRVLGDATRLPFGSNTFDLVVCQALLVNLPDPTTVIEELARVSNDRVAAIEPDNAAVTVDSTVATEPPLAKRARRAYIDGVETDVTLGSGLGERFREAGLTGVSTHEYHHGRSIEPPYSEAAIESAARKASGSRLDEQRETMLAGDLAPEEYDDLRQEWRAMGRNVIEQMREGEYEREETVPFYVTVGQVRSSNASNE